MSYKWYKVSYIAHSNDTSTVTQSKMICVEDKSAAAKVLLMLITKQRTEDAVEGINRQYKTFIEHKPNWNQHKSNRAAPPTGNCESIWGPFDDF